MPAGARKRWNCSLTEAALTQRRIEQLLGAETDSSGSDQAAASDSDAGAAGSADVETWLGAAGSGSDRSQRTRRSPAAAGSGRSAPGGRLGLLAEAVRHLERTKLRTAPPPPRRPVRPPHRKNMSFTNEEVREIDRNNRILLNKIVAQQRRPPARPSPVPGGGKSRGTQDQIRRENMILLRKIRTARPSRSVISGFHETPPPVRPILERGAVRHRQPWNDR
ncbi:Cilia- and flagella-associated protein 97 [Amphibalanus amphitrite]|uniref:Cilia-and flagella-associated protein 97 n=1 Tax=Amphibalanus amphitrite TaxID=1232801 RepID=A0A6A4VJT5_AMPAM|nr:Cilia- and flagella-associated protein 97 [Amphibalanus amphitrite]